ncbi:hypothetical protein EVAR_85339_1 [Eumeta japonica]|uniref:Uncharacterized protein n=1 Tax=Eumeta variegata TaxID=151549 RepID=A0A4C1WRB3_EUMVA|nr:hypothetical protein EVAR_85339_1 [Eumeta japonica]
MRRGRRRDAPVLKAAAALICDYVRSSSASRKPIWYIGRIELPAARGGPVRAAPARMPPAPSTTNTLSINYFMNGTVRAATVRRCAAAFLEVMKAASSAGEYRRR